MLPISLAGVIYRAAGGPQRQYSCGLSSVVRYRIGEEAFEKPLENYRIHMNGLKAAGIQRDRKTGPPLRTQSNMHDLPALSLKAK